MACIFSSYTLGRLNCLGIKQPDIIVTLSTPNVFVLTGPSLLQYHQNQMTSEDRKDDVPTPSIR